MTELRELFDKIESHRFAAMVDMASDLKTFRCVADAQPEFQELLERLRDRAAADAACARAQRLAMTPRDPSYRHPHDAAVATYILALIFWQEELAREAGAYVARTDGWWWADQMLGELGVTL
jgi:hypothetical protein